MNKKRKKDNKKLSFKIMLRLYRYMVKTLPIKKKMVVFESNGGKNYTGNPKCIYEEMVKRELDKKYKCYYIFTDTKTQIPGKAKKLKRSGLRYFYILARAGIWVSDFRLPWYIIKREETSYIQTWHGTPLKKLALDLEQLNMAGDTNLKKYKKFFRMNTGTWDYLISQNRFSTEVFRRCFAFKKEMLEIGYPRNDVLFSNNNSEYLADLKKKLNLPPDKKVILYAPTWRDDEYNTEAGGYKFSPRIDFSLMQEKLKDQYVMLVKYHYLVQDLVDWTPYQGFIYEFDKSYDISELYLAADLLITDYSSVMFDYSLLKRPMFFYAYDLDNYKDNLRGFYFDFIAEAPGPISKTTEQLIEDIRTYNRAEYQERYDAFSLKYNHADDGHASEKVVDLIVEKAEN